MKRIVFILIFLVLANNAFAESIKERLRKARAEEEREKNQAVSETVKPKPNSTSSKKGRLKNGENL